VSAEKLSKKTIFLAILGVLFVIVIFVFFEWASRPVINTPAPNTNVKGTSTEVNYTDITGENFTTQLPDIFTIKSNNASDHGNKLEQIFFTVKNSGLNNPLDDQVGISIGTPSGEGIGGISDVQLRTRHPEDYTPYYNPLLPAGYMAFETTNNPNYEISVFWPNNNKYAALVVAGVYARKAELQNTLLQATNSWQWR